jgi:phosphoinositide-3-kinase regulatory subunit 4
MGNQLTGSVSSGGDIPSYFLDIPSYVHQVILGNGKIFKSVQCLTDQGSVVVKLYIKREKEFDNKKQYESILENIVYKLSILQQPSILPLQKLEQTERAVYLIRQYFMYNLADRFHSHPFLTGIERKWLAFQLLTGLVQLHNVGLRHGDIKTENIACTSWNWLFLTDIAFYKPTYLPADNPADYSFYFESQSRRRCYLAPERFYTGTAKPAVLAISNNQPSSIDNQLTEAMDIFSLGCVIAEIFLGGEVLFDLPQLLSYRDGIYDPQTLINKIPFPDIRLLISHMIQLDPSKRFTAKQYLNRFTPRTFPAYFGFLYKFFAKLLSPELSDADIKIQAIKSHEQQIIKQITGLDKPAAAPNSSEKPLIASQPITSPAIKPQQGLPPTNLGPILDDLADFNARIAKYIENNTQPRPWQEIEKEISAKEAKKGGNSENTSPGVAKISPAESKPALMEAGSEAKSSEEAAQNDSFFVGIDFGDSNRNLGLGLTMIISILCSCVQNVRYPITKLTALELMLEFGCYVDDEVRLNRLVPYCVALLSDSSSIVRSTALTILTQLLVQVNSLTQADFHLFPEYLYPSLSRFPQDPEELVRLTYAQNIATLAETSKKFLDMAYQTKNLEAQTAQKAQETTGIAAVDPSAADLKVSYAGELNDLQDTILRLVIDMLTVGGAAVKRILLVEITRVCVFLGKARTNNEVLPHLITVLNEKHDWQLRAAFFENIIGISIYVGRTVFSHLLPCIEQALFDNSEFVIQRVLYSLSLLIELKLLEKYQILDMVAKISPCLVHPSAWIRNQAIHLISTIAANLGLAKSHCFLLPILSPFLKPISQQAQFFQITANNLQLLLKAQLTRAEFKNLTQPSAMAQSSSSSAVNIVKSSGSSVEEEEDKISATGSSGAANESSGYLTDAELQGAMQLYLNKVSASLRANPVNTAQEDEDLLYAYNHMEDDTQLYSFEIERTIPQAAIAFSPIDKVQQDLLDSLGVQMNINGNQLVMNAQKGPPHMAEEFKSNIHGNQGAIDAANSQLMQNRLAANSIDGKRGIKPIIRQTIDKIPDYIQKALRIPPAPPNLGALKLDTTSTSPFYGNFHLLDCDYELYNTDGSASSSVTVTDPRSWRPKGLLVATLNEHKSSVNRLRVSRDNLFLVSGSDDNTVKIWDCQKLKLQANARSTLTYPFKGKVKDLTMCDSSHSIAAATDTGVISVFKVELALSEDHHRYGGLTELKKIDTSEEGAVCAIEHFNTVTESLLVYATKRGVIHGWDLRSRREQFKFSIEAGMGLISALAIGPSAYCLSIGTSRGFVVVYDLRFQVPVQLWRHSNKTRVILLSAIDSYTVFPNDSNNQTQHPTNGPVLFVSVEGNNQVSAFDLYTGECRAVFRVQPDNPSAVSAAVDKRGSLFVGLSTAAANNTANLKSKVKVSPFSLPSLRSYNNVLGLSLIDETFQKELSSSIDFINNELYSVTGFKCCNQSFLLTSHTDRAIRFWDLNNAGDSYRVTNLHLDSLNEHNYAVKYSGKLENNTVVYEETTQHYPDLTQAKAAAEQKSKENGTSENHSNSNVQNDTDGSNVHNSNSSPEQQKLLLSKRARGLVSPSSAHSSEILDLVAIEFPQKMLATADRAGIVKVWI